MKPETTFRKNQVIPFLKTLKNTAYFPIQQRAIRGDPDFMLCIQGLFVGLELKKSDKDRPQVLQKQKLDQILKAGGVSIVASPESWEDTKAFLILLTTKENQWNSSALLKSP